MPPPPHPELAEGSSWSCTHRSTAITPLRSGRSDGGPSSMRTSPYSAASISEHEPRRGEKVIAKGEALGGAVADSSARGLKGRHAAASHRGPSGRAGFVNGAALQGPALRYHLAAFQALVHKQTARHPELAEGSSCSNAHRSTTTSPLRFAMECAGLARAFRCRRTRHTELAEGSSYIDAPRSTTTPPLRIAMECAGLPAH